MFFLSDEIAGLLRARLVAPELEKLGWRTAVIGPQLEQVQRRRLLAAERPDLVVLQQQRHPGNLPSLCGPVPVVFDIDDADYLDEKCRARVQACVAQSQLVLAGSRNVQTYCLQFNPHVEVVWTPTPAPARRSRQPSARRPPIVAWACSDPLALPAESEFAREVLLAAAQQARFDFWLFGVRDMNHAANYVKPLRAAGIKVRLIPLLPYEAFLALLESVAVGLNPLCEAENSYAAGKSFGKTLAYLRAEVAVVTTRTVDHPLFFRHGENGFMCERKEDWAEAVARLINQPAYRQSIVDAAFASFSEQLTTTRCARQLDRLFRELVFAHAPTQVGFGARALDAPAAGESAARTPRGALP